MAYIIRSTLAALTKHTIGRVRRRTSTKHRSMTLVVRSVRQRCRGKSKGQRPKVRRSGYVIWNHGAPGGIRTPDLQIRSLNTHVDSQEDQQVTAENSQQTGQIPQTPRKRSTPQSTRPHAPTNEEARRYRADSRTTARPQNRQGV